MFSKIASRVSRNVIRKFSVANRIKPAVLPTFHNAEKFQDKVAISDTTGQYSYSNIFLESYDLSLEISRRLVSKGKGERVLFLCPNDSSYVITLWAIWMSGHIAVPLSPLHPDSLLEYYIKDTSCELVVSSSGFQEKLDKLAKKNNIQLYVLDETLLEKSKGKTTIDGAAVYKDFPSELYNRSDAMILYTSGTTGNPKGVVLTHRNIFTQVTTLVDAWKWTSSDTILHTLPLHHVHGTINALFCPLSIGASTVMLPKFKPADVWAHLLINQKVSVFMAVPTIYSKLIDEYEAKLKSNGDVIKKSLASHVRLMVSGSAPLPTPLYEKWLNISGHRLLERYGMTEIGMCLSNLYDSDREPGYVGLPLPSVSVALSRDDEILLTCSNSYGQLSVEGASCTGELLVKGDSVFKEYFNKPEETRKEFTAEGWFKTGDVSQYDKDKNKFRMLGRKSADIIKSGGYKISALQVETLLLSHAGIKECAVLGVSDDVYGERVAAVVVLKENEDLGVDQLRAWADGKMPKYWIPSIVKVVKEIPKNVMGKVNKKELNRVLFH